MVTIIAYVAFVSTGLLVAPATEGPLTVLGRWSFTGKQHHSNGGVFLRIIKSFVQLAGGLGSERIAYIGAVKGDTSHTITFFIGNIFEFHGGLPVG